MITIFEKYKRKFEIGDIVYCVKIPGFGGFYTNRKYEIVEMDADYSDSHIRVKDIENDMMVPYWVLEENFIPEYEYDAKNYNL